MVLISLILSPILLSVASVLLPPSPAPLTVLSRVTQSSPPIVLPPAILKVLSPSKLFLVTTAGLRPRVVLFPDFLKEIL
jgi:hypothetical protein